MPPAQARVIAEVVARQDWDRATASARMVADAEVAAAEAEARAEILKWLFMSVVAQVLIVVIGMRAF